MSAKFLGDQVGFVESKVLIYKSRDDLFLLVQPTIQFVFLVYFCPKKKTILKSRIL